MSHSVGVAHRLRDSAKALPLNAKRGGTTPLGVQGWYPYYAGFSERFAQAVFGRSSLRRGATVLDPWNGSGTTTFVADRLGFRAVGFDINPVAALVASAKLVRPLDAQHVLGFARRASQEALAQSANQTNSGDPLDEWIGPEVASVYRKIEAEIVSDLATDPSGSRLDPTMGEFPPLASFLLLGLMRAARSQATIVKTTNPTWIRPNPANARPGSLVQAWLTTIQRMSNDISTFLDVSNTLSRVSVADSRALPLHDHSIDFVLTSPPYCTRIDYVVSTSFELAALGIGRRSDRFQHLRSRAMGAPLARPGPPPDVPRAWPSSVSHLLEAIRLHSSKASRSYYYKTYWQYFDDCIRSLAEIARSLASSGAAVVVVQSSNYKELHIDLPRLYLDMANAAGLQGYVLRETPVPRALVQINSRAKRHAPYRASTEAVLCLEKA